MSVLDMTLTEAASGPEQARFGWVLLSMYLLLLLLIAVYGTHRYWLVYLFVCGWRRRPTQVTTFKHMPAVTVQLPMYNESPVAERIIDAACQLDYPPDKLQIQIVDDSTDACCHLARKRCEYWAGRGVDIQHIHRTDRIGFKAGALRDATAEAKGEFIAVFDADFVPLAGFLQDTIHHFTDPKVGMVQTRWGHLNRLNSMLTRCQALFLDGHFVVEHMARNRAHCWINFNGTAGVWRRQAIESAGGWQHDTLTEDVDLSYRSQLAGWQFVYLPDVICPAELPPEINGFKAQQHRWTKGSIQTALKLLPKVMRANLPLRVKIEAFFHLTCPMVYLYVLMMILLMLPTLMANVPILGNSQLGSILLAVTCFTLATASVGLFTLASQWAQRRSLLVTLAQLPCLMSLGIGMTVNNARACIEALIGHDSPFIRTPKYSAAAEHRAPKNNAATDPPSTAAPISAKLLLPLLEIAMGCYCLAYIPASLQWRGSVMSLPFVLLFACGYFYVGVNSLKLHLASRRNRQRFILEPSS